MMYEQIADTRLRTMLSIMYSFDVINRYLQKEMRKHGSRPIRAMVLNTLRAHGGNLTPMALSKELFRAPNSITSLVYTLEREGLVEKRQSKKDARSIEVVLTGKGREVSNKLMPTMREISLRPLSVLNEEQITNVRENLKQVREYLLERLASPEADKD